MSEQQQRQRHTLKGEAIAAPRFRLAHDAHELDAADRMPHEATHKQRFICRCVCVCVRRCTRNPSAACRILDHQTTHSPSRFEDDGNAGNSLQCLQNSGTYEFATGSSPQRAVPGVPPPLLISHAAHYGKHEMHKSINNTKHAEFFYCPQLLVHSDCE